MTRKYARIIIKGDGLEYRKTIPQIHAAKVIEYLSSLPKGEVLGKKPVGRD